MSFAVPAPLEARLDELTTHYPQKRSASLMFLHALQEHFGHISDEAVEWTARKLGLTPINVHELVTLSCALAGSAEVRAHFCEKLGLDAHAHAPQTTADGKFTVEFVECLAACGSAPVVLVNEDLHEKVTAAKADDILRTGK